MREIESRYRNWMEGVGVNQTLEKSALIVGGTTLITAGIGLVETNSGLAITFVVLGEILLIAREIIKLKR